MKLWVKMRTMTSKKNDYSEYYVLPVEKTELSTANFRNYSNQIGYMIIVYVDLIFHRDISRTLKLILSTASVPPSFEAIQEYLIAIVVLAIHKLSQNSAALEDQPKIG